MSEKEHPASPVGEPVDTLPNPKPADRDQNIAGDEKTAGDVSVPASQTDAPRAVAYDDDEEAPTPFIVTLPDDPNASRDWLLWAGVLFLLVATAFFPAVYGTFLWDDNTHVTNNANLLSAEGLQKIWTSMSAEPQYYPLTHTVFWVEHYFWAFNPLGYHITNMALQALSALLVWRILRRLGIPGAFVAAAIWAIHPLQAETVDWITELKNCLSGTLFFCSIWFYLDFADISKPKEKGLPQVDLLKNQWGAYACSLALFVAALLSKTTACALPAVMLVVLWQQGKLKDLYGWALAPFFVIGAAMGLMTAHLEKALIGPDQINSPAYDYSFVQRFLIAGKALWFYAGKIVFPWKLAFSYPLWNVSAGDALLWIFPIAAIAAIVVLWALRDRIGRGPIAAVLWYCICLFPALGFFTVLPMRYSLVADHFQYLAGLGLITLIVATIATKLEEIAARQRPAVLAAHEKKLAEQAEALKASKKTGGDESPQPAGRAPELPPPLTPATKIAVGISVAAVLLAAGLTWAQSQIYVDPESLWRDTLAKNDQSWMASFNLARELVKDAADQTKAGNLPEAKADLDEALGLYDLTAQLKPDHEYLHLERGVAYMQRSKLLKAYAAQLVASTQPSGVAQASAAQTSADTTQASAAQNAFNTTTAPSATTEPSGVAAATTAPSDSGLTGGDGNAQAGADQAGGDQSADQTMTAAQAEAQSKLDDQSAFSELKLAIAESDSGANKNNPSLAYHWMGALLMQDEKYADAIPYLHKAIELADLPDPRTGLDQDPATRDVPRYLLAKCYAELGQWKPAADYAGEAVGINPDDNLARYNYAEWLRNEGFSTKDKALSHALLEKAEQQYAIYLLQAPTDAGAWYQIARVRVANVNNAHDLYVAGEYANQALTLDPNNPQIQREADQIRQLMEIAKQQLLAASTRPTTQPGAAPTTAP